MDITEQTSSQCPIHYKVSLVLRTFLVASGVSRIWSERHKTTWNVCRT